MTCAVLVHSKAHKNKKRIKAMISFKRSTDSGGRGCCVFVCFVLFCFAGVVYLCVGRVFKLFFVLLVSVFIVLWVLAGTKTCWDIWLLLLLFLSVSCFVGCFVFVVVPFF